MTSRVFQFDQSNPHWRNVQTLLNNHIVSEVSAGRVIRVTVGEPKRTLAENALLHALLSQVANELTWAGKKRDVEIWKRLMCAAWARARGDAIEILPALDGHGVDIVPIRTSRLNKKDCAELIEFVLAWGAEQGIIWKEVER